MEIKESAKIATQTLLVVLKGTLLFLAMGGLGFLIWLASQRYSDWWLFLFVPYLWIVIFFIDLFRDDGMGL